MKKFVCSQCDFVYDPAEGIPDTGSDSSVPHGGEPDEVFFDRDAPMVPPGTSFSDLPSAWVCPRCGRCKADFHPAQ